MEKKYKRRKREKAVKAIKLIKGNLHSYDKLTLNYWKGLLNSKTYLKTRKYIFNKEIGYINVYVHFKFPGGRHFGFYDVKGVKRKAKIKAIFLAARLAR